MILLADVSGSTKEDGKIDALNEAVTNMISSFSEEESARAEIQLAVITFGTGGAKLHRPLCSAVSGEWAPLTAKGPTPLGDALQLARNLMEDREQIPSRAYRPTLILISDGHPTGPDGKPNDEWRTALDKLLQSERASKAVRFAMAIGDDADLEVLKAFLADESRQVFTGSQARQIKQFFRWVPTSRNSVLSASVAPVTGYTDPSTISDVSSVAVSKVRMTSVPSGSCAAKWPLTLGTTPIEDNLADVPLRRSRGGRIVRRSERGSKGTWKMRFLWPRRRPA